MVDADAQKDFEGFCFAHWVCAQQSCSVLVSEKMLVRPRLSSSRVASLPRGATNADAQMVNEPLRLLPRWLWQPFSLGLHLNPGEGFPAPCGAPSRRLAALTARLHGGGVAFEGWFGRFVLARPSCRSPLHCRPHTSTPGRAGRAGARRQAPHGLPHAGGRDPSPGLSWLLPKGAR